MHMLHTRVHGCTSRSRPCAGAVAAAAVQSQAPVRCFPVRRQPEYQGRGSLQAQASGMTAAPPTDIAANATLEAFTRLQNGSDIRGVAIARAPGDEVTLSPAAVTCIAAAFAEWLQQQQQQQQESSNKESNNSSSSSNSSNKRRLVVALGADPRLSGPLLRAAAVAGLMAGGADVQDAGLSTTPAMFYALVAPGSEVDGSIMLTASHMPSHNNGMKFFTRAGGLDKKDIQQLLQAAGARAVAAALRLGDPLSDTAYTLNTALTAARQGHYQQVLAPLGADTSGSQFLDPDGSFPNHIPNPEAKEAMDAAVSAVKAAGADLGIVFDTDVDRCAIVDEQGQPINSNRFIALMAAIVLRQYPGTTIVTDSVTSNGLTRFIEGLGGKHFRYKRGYKNVISKGQDLAAAGTPTALMMETSGHGALADNNYLDDGAQLAVLALIQMVQLRVSGGGSLSDMLSQLQQPAESCEYRLAIKGSGFKEVGAKVVQGFSSWVEGGAGGAPGWALEPVNHEGVRVNVGQGQSQSSGQAAGWALLRQSLHDPLLVLNIESDVAGGEAAIRGAIRSWMQQHFADQVELSTLPPP